MRDLTTRPPPTVDGGVAAMRAGDAEANCIHNFTSSIIDNVEEQQKYSIKVFLSGLPSCLGKRISSPAPNLDRYRVRLLIKVSGTPGAPSASGWMAVNGFCQHQPRHLTLTLSRNLQQRRWKRSPLTRRARTNIPTPTARLGLRILAHNQSWHLSWSCCTTPASPSHRRLPAQERQEPQHEGPDSVTGLKTASTLTPFRSFFPSMSLRGRDPLLKQEKPGGGSGLSRVNTHVQAMPSLEVPTYRNTIVEIHKPTKANHSRASGSFCTLRRPPQTSTGMVVPQTAKSPTGVFLFLFLFLPGTKQTVPKVALKQVHGAKAVLSSANPQPTKAQSNASLFCVCCTSFPVPSLDFKSPQTQPLGCILSTTSVHHTPPGPFCARGEPGGGPLRLCRL